jgi:PAS domain S-box-containing protein
MGIRALVVEDSRTQAEALRLLLEENDYGVTVATDGEGALDVVRTEPVDVVISDITMPGLSGYEVCKRIKGQLRKPDLPVLLLTALSDPMDVVQGLEAGADGYVTKPYEPEQLIARISHILKNKELRRGAPSRVGVSVTFLGSTFNVTSEKEQILDLLISTFEDAVIQNRRLRDREAELESAKAQLARYAGKLEERLQAVLDSVPDVVFSMSPDGRELHYLSPATKRVFGLSQGEIASDPLRWTASIIPEDREQAATCFRLAADAGQSGSVVYRYRHPDGSQRWIESTFIPVPPEPGRVTRVDGVARDITEAKRLEEQLRLAQKLEAVGTLAAGVAHDFNNVLATIRGTADLAMLDLDKKSPLHPDLVQIREAVDRGAALTRQLLAFGRRQTLEARPVDINALVKGVQGMLDRVIGKDVKLSSQLAAESCVVMADPGQVEQVLMNLCVNARDAMPTGGDLALLTERVYLDESFHTTHPWAREGDFVQITVSDTGHGMDAATQARIFEPFFTTKEMGHGTGLGLAVVYGIVKQHQGLIHVYSEPGRGTTFRIYFPFLREEAVAVAPKQSAEMPKGRETILLAEDDGALRMTIARMLERLGYRVVLASTGKEALHVLSERASEFDLVVLDVVMPEMGGVAVFEEVHTKHPDIRFLFVTGYSPGTTHFTALQTLPAKVLQKPFAAEALAQVVRRTLDA